MKVKLLKTIWCLVVVAIIFPGKGFSQSSRSNRMSDFVKEKKQTETFQSISLFSTTDYPELLTFAKSGTAMLLNQQKLTQMLAEENNAITLALPAINGTVYELELVKVNILSEGFKVGTKGLQSNDAVSYTPGLYYRGIIKGDEHSIASVSFFNNEVMGIFCNASGNFNLGQVKNIPGLYVSYNDKDEIKKPLINCGTAFREVNEETGNKGGNPNLTVVNCKIVNCYYECDFAMYQDFSSNTTSTANYLTGAFNNEATLYINDGITIQISQIFVWTSTDPEASLTSTSSVNNSFAARTGSSWIGDMAQFLTTRSLGGGIAQGFNGLCNKTEAHSCAEIYTSYSPFPTYSWTVMVMTHEMGHLLGSRHTHACVWNGNNTSIDGCADYVEGSCTLLGYPSGGGTLMSYCHIQSVGINFNNGFGPQPGGLLLSNVNNASCLTGSGAATPTGLVTSGISNNAATISWGAVSGATQYTVEYKITSAGNFTSLGNFTGTTANLSGLSASTNYTWRVQADCSPFASLTFTTNALAGCGVPSSLTSNNLTSTSVKVNWSAFAGVTSYTVRYQVFGTTNYKYATAYNAYKTLSGLIPSTKYTWTVKSKCSNGSVTAYAGGKTFTTKSTTAPTNYCVANGSITSSEYISNCTFGTINNTTGDNGGYGNFTGQSTNIAPGNSYSLSVSIFKANSADLEYVKVWIDYNRDGDFTDGNEMVYTNNSVNTTFNGTISVPGGAGIGYTRMRVTAEYGSNPVPCGTYQYGETEDYLVNITTTPSFNDESRLEITSEESEFDFSLSPNPASTSIQLAINSETNEVFQFIVYTITGQEVKRLNLSGRNVSIDLSDMKNGFYQVRLSDQYGNTRMKKFVKN